MKDFSAKDFAHLIYWKTQTDLIISLAAYFLTQVIHRLIPQTLLNESSKYIQNRKLGQPVKYDDVI